MHRRTLTSTVAALGIIAVVGLVAALAPFVPWPNLARAHSADDAALRALTVTPGTLAPSFNRTVYLYAVTVADTVTRITIAGTPDGDGTVAYQEANGAPLTDADPNTGGQQVDIPTEGKPINVVVTHMDGGTTTTQTYAVLVIREGPVAADTIALMALYNSTGGANWTRSTNWGSTVPLHNWARVTTDPNGRVLLLDLWENNLIGTLPSSLGSLTKLTELSLLGNQLSGTIPSSLGNLTNLEILQLNQNQLTGSIPSSLGSLTNLTVLNLWDNQLTGTLPSSLGKLTNLTSLSLLGNQLSGRIPDLGRLASLRGLYLSRNQLTGEIPAWLSSLTNLQNLYLNENQLTGEIPASLGSLTNLVQLYLNGNQLSGPIPDLGRLTSLTQLSLWGNQLTGPIPAWVSSLTNLQYLYLGSNRLEGPIPSSLGNLTSLLELSLWGNQLTGPVPDLSRLTSLQLLGLESNELSGEIPSSLSSLTSLTVLRLWGNQLTGSIPSSLSSLTNLQQLHLSRNQLTGPIPSSLSSLTNLMVLSLDHNQLTGPIPSSLGSLTNLTDLNLFNNRLTGPIPSSLGSLTNLDILSLDRNYLTGPFPDLSRLTNLKILSIWRNQLTGPIPAELGSLTNLTFVALQDNQLTGAFPAELGNLTNLEVAYFSPNELTGCVPLGLRYLLSAEEYAMGQPAQDFIAIDLNGDGDSDDFGERPGLNLPFCMLSALEFSGVTLVPSFTSDTAAYTAVVANTVESTTVTATLPDVDAGDRLSIRKGTSSYASEDAVPLHVGSNEITIEVTPSNSALFKQTFTVQLFRAASAASDMAALLALYNSAGGARWTDNTNWDSAQSLNTWYGVTTSGGRVTDLDLSDNNLAGTLPAELGGLTELTSLDLSGNQLRGMLPDLRSLTELTTLNLSSNQLRGMLPDLRSLTQLRALYLNGNRLNGDIPEALGDFTGLQELSLRNNRLSGPIPDLSSLFQLRLTRFAGNGLTGCVPDGLRNLLTAAEFAAGVPAQDFIAVDANNDGDTNEVGDTPGLNLPFCGLRLLSLSGVTLKPDFASGTVAYTASVPLEVESPSVTATLHNNTDTVSIMKGTDTYMSGDAVPLDVGVNVITIEATTADGSPTPHSYTVTVTRQTNPPPVFDEGATTRRGVVENTAADVNIGDPVAATDPDSGDTLTYSLDDAGAESFAIDTASGQLQTKAALDYETRNSYRVTVSVRDSKDDQGDADERTDATITVTILVAEVNEAPAFPPLVGDTRTIPENSAAGVNLGAPFTATDPDTSDTLTYSLGGAGAVSFTIDPVSGQLRTKAALDYEAASSHTVTVTATDSSGATATAILPLLVTNVEEPGRVALSTVQPLVGTAFTATLDYPDVASGVTWSWESSTNRSNWAIISGETSATYTPVAGDEGRYLRATASYDDGEGSGKSARAVSLNPVRVAAPGNNAPSFPLSETGARSVTENASAGMDIGEPFTATDLDSGDTLTYWLSGAGAESFDLDASTGQLRTKSALDFEVTPTYNLTVTVTDPSGAVDTITVTITVENIEEPGTVTLSSLQPQVATQLTAALTDPDGGVANPTWIWERSPNPNQISSWTPVSGAVAGAYTPVASDVGNYLRATVSYEDGEGMGKSARGVSVNAVREAPGGHAPVFTEGASTSRSIAKNPAEGTKLGAPVTATDADNDALTYTLGGADRALFNIVGSSGQLLTRIPLSGISRTEYTVSVSVSDGRDDQGLPDIDQTIDATTGVTITITTVARRSSGGGGRSRSSGGGGGGGGGRSSSSGSVVFTDGTIVARSVAENTVPDPNDADADKVGAPVAATDANNNPLTYSLGGANAALFTIDADTGQLRVGAGTALDYETTSSYAVTVVATGGRGGSARITVIILVTDVGLGPYDVDNNEVIDRDEVLAAVADYNNDLISKEEMLEVIKLYFST